MRKSQSNFISQFGSNFHFGSNDPNAPQQPQKPTTPPPPQDGGTTPKAGKTNPLFDLFNQKEDGEPDSQGQNLIKSIGKFFKSSI